MDVVGELSSTENSEVTLFAPKSFVKIELKFIYFPFILSLKFESCGCLSDLSFISNNNRVESFPYSSILLVIFRDDGPSCEAVTDLPTRSAETSHVTPNNQSEGCATRSGPIGDNLWAYQPITDKVKGNAWGLATTDACYCLLTIFNWHETNEILSIFYR